MSEVSKEWPVTEKIKLPFVPDGSESEYYEEIGQLIHRNRHDYVPRKSYEASDGVPSDDFFHNYRKDGERLLIVENTDTEDTCGFATVDTPSQRSDIPAEQPFTYYSLMMVDSKYRGREQPSVGYLRVNA